MANPTPLNISPSAWLNGTVAPPTWFGTVSDVFKGGGAIMAWAVVNSDGTIASSYNITSIVASTFTYTITLSVTATAISNVCPMAMLSGIGGGQTSAQVTGPSQIVIKTFNAAGTGAANAFYLIVAGNY